ncbi:Gfo/Idh/MocA family oxidoreductase [Phytoactinopolyspora halotolerans]|uniref:Gfo/Idh/MocA family oxidoreductase n=1 Tax=Phytoactinopolyspora halotolerans TaxID=1981512 RepID=A0A6L9S9F7_9ACTN|nr:Gfo/Idh/MocA family oxidoreductase [Phytoactinopolyspora halotolerans]
MLRIGVIGTENSHTDHFVRHLNVEGRHEGCRVVVLAGGDTEKNRQLAVAGQIDDIVETAEDLVDRVDAAIVADRHGGLHRSHAEPLLDAGKHVFVDKPTALTVADTKAIIAAAERGGGVLGSWSAVRLSPTVDEIRAATSGLGDIQTVAVTGPADRDDPHAGLFFYGSHVVEPALELLGNPDVTDVHTLGAADSVTATARAGDVQLSLSFVRPDTHGRVPWHMVVAGRHGLVARELELGADYNARGLARFIDAALSGVPPMPYEQLLPPVQLLETVVAQL